MEFLADGGLRIGSKVAAFALLFLAVSHLDHDGEAGETQHVQIKVQAGTNLYSFGPFSSPPTAGNCTNGGCLNVQPLVLAERYRLVPRLCTVTGLVAYSGLSMNVGLANLAPGDGVAFANVAGFDPDASDAAWLTCSNCMFTLTDSQGYFGLQVPVVSGLTLAVGVTRPMPAGYGVFNGVSTFAACPGEVILDADYIGLGPFEISLYQDDQYVGSAVIRNDAIAVTTFADAGRFYIGSKNSVSPPVQAGAWTDLPMRNRSPDTYVGNIYFTVTQLVPPAGTWRIQGGSANLFGTWEADFSLP